MRPVLRSRSGLTPPYPEYFACLVKCALATISSPTPRSSDAPMERVRDELETLGELFRDNKVCQD